MGMQQFNEIMDQLDEHNYFVNSTNIDGGEDTFTEEDQDDLERFFRIFLIIGYAIGAIFTALFVYPSFCFVREVRNGIMTKETYPREEHSCCCTSSR